MPGSMKQHSSISPLKKKPDVMAYCMLGISICYLPLTLVSKIFDRWIAYRVVQTSTKRSSLNAVTTQIPEIHGYSTAAANITHATK